MNDLAALARQRRGVLGKGLRAVGALRNALDANRHLFDGRCRGACRLALLGRCRGH